MKRVGEFLNFWDVAFANKGFLIDKSAMVILMDCDKPWTREHLDPTAPGPWDTLSITGFSLKAFRSVWFIIYENILTYIYIMHSSNWMCII